MAKAPAKRKAPAKKKPARKVAPSPVRALVLAGDIVEASRYADWYKIISDKHFKGKGIKHPETGGYLNAEAALVWAAATFVPPERKKALAARAIQEVVRIAFSDIRKVFGSSGDVIHPSAIDDDTAAAISNLEVVTRTIPGKGDEAEVEHVHKFKLIDKMRALEGLLKMNGDFVERTEITGKDGGAIETKDMSVDEAAFRILRSVMKSTNAQQTPETGDDT